MDQTVTRWYEAQDGHEIEVEATFYLGEAWRRGDEGPRLVSGPYVISTEQPVEDPGLVELMAERAEEIFQAGPDF